jgi:nucleoside-diphosphate-sugar epimerase
MTKLLATIRDEEQLDDLLSQPSPELVELMKRLDGDIIILGIAGKIGVSLGRCALNAIRQAGVRKRVCGVARFSTPGSREKIESYGIETIACDLLDRDAVAALPQMENVIYMAGRKFGTDGREDLTWMMNTVVADNVTRHFRDSRIVAFSTGCVYPLVTAATGGCDEDVPPDPVGEYAQSCLGRERIFQYAALTYGTKVTLFRLNYAIDLRYGVLHDIGRAILAGEEVDNSVGHFNVIWQGDTNNIALRSLAMAASPAAILNVTGPETIAIEDAARALAEQLGKPLRFRHERSGDVAYLSNASRMISLFGPPTVPLESMIAWQADWLRKGGVSLGKPTHFEVNDGKY